MARGEYLQPIGRHPTIRVEMSVSDKGKPAWTKWKVLKNFGHKFTLVECPNNDWANPPNKSAFSSVGHPLAGDCTYGFRSKVRALFLLMLHAYKLIIEHPTIGEVMEFTATLPAEFLARLKTLETEQG